MKIEDMKGKIKYKNQIKNKNGIYNANPDIIRIKIAPHDSSDQQGSLENQLNNSKTESNSISNKLYQNINLDAKIARRKKREGD